MITGASTGIGYELAIQCAKHGYDLVVAADEKQIHEAAEMFRKEGGKVDALEANLATTEGCDKLYTAIGGRPVDALLANAGRGLGRAFLDQDWSDIRYVIDTNVDTTQLPIGTCCPPCIGTVWRNLIRSRLPARRCSEIGSRYAVVVRLKCGSAGPR